MRLIGLALILVLILPSIPTHSTSPVPPNANNKCALLDLTGPHGAIYTQILDSNMSTSKAYNIVGIKIWEAFDNVSQKQHLWLAIIINTSMPFKQVPEDNPCTLMNNPNHTIRWVVNDLNGTRYDTFGENITATNHTFFFRQIIG